jgi:adenine phosphoribosyltransferase
MFCDGVGLDLHSKIASFPDFPKKGILFRDISPVLRDPEAFDSLIGEMAQQWKGKKVDLLLGIEARGFIFAAALGLKLNRGFAMARKKGKLPGRTVSLSYEIEYGTDVMEIQETAIRRGESVLIVDDLLATGGTARAAAKLVEKTGGRVAGMAFAIELEALRGRKNLEDYEVVSTLKY